MKLKYEKSPLPFEEQADQLKARGMEGDRDLIVKRLRDVNYYRLSAYWHPHIPLENMGFIKNWTTHPLWAPSAIKKNDQ